MRRCVPPNAVTVAIPGRQLSQRVVPLCGAPVTTCLLLEHIDGVIIFHVEACWRVRLVDWLAVKSEPDILDAEARTIAVSRHELPQWRVLLYFEVHDASILTNNLQIDVLVVRFNILEISEIRESSAKRLSAILL